MPQPDPIFQVLRNSNDTPQRKDLHLVEILVYSRLEERLELMDAIFYLVPDL
jgi:hypothetical protein